MRVKGLVALGVACLLAGCAGSTKAVKQEPVYIGTTVAGTGIHLKYAKRLSYYRPVGHHLQVDRSQPVWLAPEGEITVYLTPGPHQMFVSSLSAAKEAEANLGAAEGYNPSHFGYTSRHEFVLQPNEIRQFRYTPPLLSERSGTIEEVEPR